MKPKTKAMAIADCSLSWNSSTTPNILISVWRWRRPIRGLTLLCLILRSWVDHSVSSRPPHRRSTLGPSRNQNPFAFVTRGRYTTSGELTYLLLLKEISFFNWSNHLLLMIGSIGNLEVASRVSLLSFHSFQFHHAFDFSFIHSFIHSLIHKFTLWFN